MNYSGYFKDSEGNRYYANPIYDYLKCKYTLPKGISFNDVLTSGENSVYSIAGDYNNQSLPGFPTGAYTYGILITLNPNKRTSSSENLWNVSQIYIPDLPATNGVYFRTRLTATWCKLTGTSVNPKT